MSPLRPYASCRTSMPGSGPSPSGIARAPRSERPPGAGMVISVVGGSVLTARSSAAVGPTTPPGVLAGGRPVAGVAWLDVRPRRHELVDPVEHLVAQDHVGGAQLALEVVHGPGPDDRGRDRGVDEHESQGQVHERAP